MNADRRAKFGGALRQSLTSSGMSQSELARQIGTTQAAVYNWVAGRHLPMVETTARMADVLGDPHLLKLLISLRTMACEVCKRPLVRGSKSARIFCGPDCSRLAEKGIKRTPFRDPEGRQSAIEAMCRSCEPDGVCRQAKCPLRRYSPLPFVHGMNRSRNGEV